MGGFAWVTLATNDSYSLGALVLAHSLKQTGTAHQLAVLVSPGVTNVMRQKLASVFNVVQEVNILDSKDEANLRLLKRPELGVTFTKLHCWRLTQFDKCVFLDADTLVLKNCDDIFGYEEFSAAPDVGWPDCFNSGVFVFRPSNETYEKLVAFAIEKGSFDGGDQGLLNLYFSGWAHKDISKHLPFIYNMCSTACYSYLPAFKQFGINVRIVHFIGSSKPWLQYFNSETKQVEPSGDLQHLRSVLQCWWNIFCAQIHPNLSTEMGGLAGAFAQLTLGSPRSPAQNALEDHLRRQGWEVGHIDYLGRDSFDNIWSKICETLSSGPPPQAKETPAQEVTEPQPKLETAEISPAPIESEATQTTPIDATKVEQPTKTPEEQTVSEPKCDTSVPVDSAKPVEVPKTPEASSQKIEEPSKPLDVKIESETIIEQTKSPIEETPKPIDTSKLAEEPKATESKPLEEIPILAQEALPVAICKLAGVEVPKPAEAPKSTETSPKTPEETVKAIEEITKLCEKASEVAATVLDGGLKITEQVPIVALKLAEQAPQVAETCPLAKAPQTTEEKIMEEPSKKAEEVPKAAEEVTKAAEEVPQAAEEVTKPAEEVTKAAEEVTKAAEKVTKAAEEIPKATEDLGSKVEAVKPVEEALKATEVLKDIAGIIKPIEEIPKLTPEVPKAAEEVIQQIVAPKPEELVTQDIPKTLEEMLKIDTQAVSKAEIAQTEVSDVIPVSVDEIKPTDTAKGAEALAKSPEKEEAKSKGKKGSKGEGKGHKHVKEAPKPPTKPTEPIKSKTPPKTDGDKEVKKLSEKDSESTIAETPKTEAQQKCEKKAKDAVKPPQEEKEKEIPSEAPKSEEKAVKPQEEAKTETAEKSKKSKQPNKSPKPTEAASEVKAELTEVPKAGETKKDAKKCKKCPVKKDCPKEECKECPEKSCPKEPAKEEPTPDVPKTPEVIEATPPTTPAAEKPLEEKALSAETVVPVSPPPTSAGAAAPTPPPTSAGAAAPTPPPRKSSSGNKKSKAKK